MAIAVLGSRVRKGSARPFIGVGEGKGELGREQLGQGAMLGEDADSARRSAMAMAWQAGARAGVRGSSTRSQGGVVLVTQWACRWIGRGCDAWGGQVASPAYGAAVGRAQGGRGGR